MSENDSKSPRSGVSGVNLRVFFCDECVQSSSTHSLTATWDTYLFSLAFCLFIRVKQWEMTWLQYESAVIHWGKKRRASCKGAWATAQCLFGFGPWMLITIVVEMSLWVHLLNTISWKTTDCIEQGYPNFFQKGPILTLWRWPRAGGFYWCVY